MTKTKQMLKLMPFVLLIFFSFSGKSQINMVVKEGGFLFMEGKDSIFFYQKNPKGKRGEYSRCNYLYPLFGPDNSRLTEDFPADHLHRRGVFWAWHQILIDDKLISDGWELKNFQQKISTIEFKLHKGIGILNTTVDWKSPLWENGSEAYLQEETTINMYPKTGNYRRIDFNIKLKALTDRLSIGGSVDEKGYSGFSVRLKLPADVSFLGEKGLVEPANTAVSAGNKMKIYGSFLKDGKKGGVVIFNNPENPKPSDSWILRKIASMQNAAYPGRQTVVIPFDQPLVLKYSLLVFQGDMSMKQIKKALK
jgi:hypothetical protein